MAQQGYIYALINPSLHGLVKVGKTVKEPEARAKEISSDTGVPTPFIVAFKVFVSDCDAAELFLHSLLQIKGFRINQNREFFNAPLEEIINSMIELQNSSNFKATIETPEIITEDSNDSFVELEDDFLNELEVEQSPVYVDVLDEADNLYYGLGDSLQDYSEALKLYKHAIKLGGIEAYSRIGQMYIDGEGCRADNQLALNYLKEGVSKGNENCYYDMGILFSNAGNQLNMNKCFKKYFLSSTFIEDKQNKVIITDRIGNLRTYLTIIEQEIENIDSEIISIFIELRESIIDGFNKKIEYLLSNTTLAKHADLYERSKEIFFKILELNIK